MSNNLNTNFGALWEVAKRQGLKKVDVYKPMDIARGTLDSWIKGESHPDLSELRQFYQIAADKGIIIDTTTSFEDRIFKGEYLGIHRSIWVEMQKSMENDRRIASSLSETVRELSKGLQKP